MSCCNEVIDLGCVNYCSTFDTGYDALQNGTHTLHVYLNSTVVQTASLGSLTIGDDIIIPAETLNEAKVMDMKVEQPDGTFYEFTTEVYCVRVTTVYHTSLADVIT